MSPAPPITAASTRERWPLVAIVGPTASGKTGLALELARRLPAEIVNVDSMQVYRGLDVGTDKPTAAMRAEVAFHLVDVLEPGQGIDAASFAALADEAIAGIVARGRMPLAAGGTGLYHRAVRHGLVEGPARDEALRATLRARRDALGVETMHAELARVDAATAARTHPRDWVRIERALEVHALTGRPLSELHAAHGGAAARDRYRVLVLGCFRPRAELHARIETRLREMWHGGLLDETRWLLERGHPPDELPLKALGYQHAARMLRGELTPERALELAMRDTRRFARRQMTWFRSVHDTHWLQMGALDDAVIERLARAVATFAADPQARDFSYQDLPLVDAS